MSDALRSFFSGAARRRFSIAAGASVFHTGDRVRRIYFVTAGSIHLIRHQARGAPIVLQRATAGSVLAEASLYSDLYHCDATAADAASGWSVSKTELQNRLADTPDFARAWARRLAQEVQRARFQAEMLAMKTVAERLDAWIAWHGRLPARGSWIALASEIAVAPEALYRELAKRRADEGAPFAPLEVSKLAL